MPRVQNPSIGAGATNLLTTTTQVSRAQLLDLFNTPVTLIPAPGTGKLILVMGVAAVYSFGTVAYSSKPASLLQFFYDGPQGDNVVGVQTNLLGPAASGFSYSSGITQAPNGGIPGDVNQGVVMQCSNDLSLGPIVTTTLGAGGLGYLANDTGTITTGNGDATYTVLTVGAGGAVLTYSITAPGTDYATANGVATATGGAQPGVGVGFTVNITAVQTGDGTLKVVTYYQIIPVP